MPSAMAMHDPPASPRVHRKSAAAAAFLTLATLALALATLVYVHPAHSPAAFQLCAVANLEMLPDRT